MFSLICLQAICGHGVRKGLAGKELSERVRPEHSKQDIVSCVSLYYIGGSLEIT